MFLEKQPIYISDSIVNPADLFNTTFKYLYVKHVLSISDEQLIKQNLSKFLLIYNDQEDSDVVVKLSHPINKQHIPIKQMHLYAKNYNISNLSNLNQIQHESMQIVDVILKPKHIIILPINWYYHTTTSGILEIHLHDCISLIYSIL